MRDLHTLEVFTKFWFDPKLRRSLAARVCDPTVTFTVAKAVSKRRVALG